MHYNTPMKYLLEYNTTILFCFCKYQMIVVIANILIKIKIKIKELFYSVRNSKLTLFPLNYHLY